MKIYFNLFLLVLIISCGKDSPVETPTPQIIKFSITFSNGSGGSVSIPGGSYETGTSVSVSATPDSEYVFVDWSNGSTQNPLSVTVTSNQSITANFEKRKYPLTVSITGSGTVSEEIISAGKTTTEYTSGSIIQLTATSDTGWEFTGWSGTVSSSENPIQLTVDESKTLEAAFGLISYNVIVNSSEGGDVSSIGGELNYGQILSILASPEDGYFFQGWEGDITSYQDSISLSIDSDKSITAKFFQAPNCLPSTNNTDVFNQIEFSTVNTVGNKNYNCLIVNSNNGHPVLDGEESARFELRTELGDCGYTPNGLSDCETNRSRHEIFENWIPEYDNIIGKKVTYEFSIYIPSTEYFSPNPSGKPLTVLGQVFSQSEGDNTVNDEINSQSCDSKALLYFVMEGNTLKYLTHKPFTWMQNDRVIIDENPFDKWMNFKIEINVSTGDDGYIKLFVNNELFNEDNRQTMCSTGNTSLNLKLGIYNSYIQEKSMPFLKQVVYYDRIKRTISN